MKRLMICIGLVVALTSNTAIFGQDVSLLTTRAVNQLDTAKSTADWIQARSTFERLVSLTDKEWLPLYYLIYTDIELSFRVETKKEKALYLDDALTHLENIRKLQIKADSIRSEISTLRGYWYFAQMALDPAGNGPRYAGVITDSYETARKQNPDNPRAILLYAYFLQNMGKYMGDGYSGFEADLERAQQLFQQEDKESSFPHWGASNSY